MTGVTYRGFGAALRPKSIFRRKPGPDLIGAGRRFAAENALQAGAQSCRDHAHKPRAITAANTSNSGHSWIADQ
jgi:hypothetical protein